MTRDPASRHDPTVSTFRPTTSARYTTYRRRLATSSLGSLALSLIFGLGQLLIGGLVALRIARSGAWRVFGQYLLMLVALWFVFSGLAELLVSGMESARTVTSHPSLATFTILRSHIDAALLVVSLLLLLALALYPLARRLRPSTIETATAEPTLDGKRTQ